MTEFDHDLFVIGGGSGGVRAARIAAQHGARVAIAEEYRYGGTCVIRGCVPKKLMVYASLYSELFEDAEGFGWTVAERRFDWGRFRAAMDRELDRLEAAYVRNLDAAGVEVHRTRATIADPHSVRLEADGRTVSAKHILIATGGRPFVPDFEGCEHAITSNEMFKLEEKPRRIVIVGGGYIACEFACIMNGLGSTVTQLYRGPMILRGFDDEVRRHVADEAQRKGVDIRCGADVAAIRKEADCFRVICTDEFEIEADQVLYATGRHPNTSGLGLEDAGVKPGTKGEVTVDEWSQTSVPSIYAVGDVTDRVALTPVAIREGHAFADTVFGATPTKADHALVPTAVFTQPEIGTIGPGEEKAREDHDITVYASTFRPMQATLSGRDERMLMKMIVEKGTERVLAVHIVGHGAAEMIQMAGVAVKMGATKADFDRTVAVHPTAAEELVTMRTPRPDPT
ncbi:MAG TPA: glutathione-disulfide reductase [Paracoccaceae bacterium]|nr:glutathione-disulfide reductase [Paracoccaceae bacterium]